MTTCSLCDWVENPLVFAGLAIVTGGICLLTYWMDRR